MKPKSQKLDPEAAARLVQPRDTVLCGFVAGQPVGFLDALGARTDLEDVALYTGLLTRPFALLQNPGVRVVSGFFGPIERMARAAGARVSYLPADFNGLERRALRMKPRVALAVTSLPDREGWLSFGVQAGASYRPFLEAARDPERLAIAEVNPRMPRIDGVPEFGRNRVHLSEVDAWVEHETERILAERPAGGVGAHTEMIADGVMRLHEAGKVTNRKPLYDGFTVATFALGSEQLYRWLDGNPSVRILPVTDVNESSVLQQLPRLTSINGALSIDLAGQVAADSIGGRQYSGTGGHESFVSGAAAAPGGRSFLCLKSTAKVGGQRVSTIVRAFGEGTRVTTPRHHVQWVVTEYGAVDLSVLSDAERPQALIELAHPDFRASLRAAAP